MTITLELTEQEHEILRAAMNKVCADYICRSVEITESEFQRDIWSRLYDKACVVRDKVYSTFG